MVRFLFFGVRPMLPLGLFSEVFDERQSVDDNADGEDRVEGGVVGEFGMLFSLLVPMMPMPVTLITSGRLMMVPSS